MIYQNSWLRQLRISTCRYFHHSSVAWIGVGLLLFPLSSFGQQVAQLASTSSYEMYLGVAYSQLAKDGVGEMVNGKSQGKSIGLVVSAGEVLGTDAGSSLADSSHILLVDTTNSLAGDTLLTAADSLTQVQDSRLQKPEPLRPIIVEYDDPLSLLDLLVVEKHGSLKPYIPFVQHIDFLIDYGKLATTLLTKFESKYEGGIGVLFRRNIHLATAFGHAQLNPKNSFKNSTDYTIQGNYFRVGLAYLVHYDLENNLYLGLQYGRSFFEDKGIITLENAGSTVPHNVDRKDLVASWFEVVLGSETKLIKKLNLYVGFFLKLRILDTFENVEPARVYAIPGYGRTADRTVPVVNLYAKYNLSFLNKYFPPH